MEPLEVKWEFPPDEYWEYPEYVSTYGCRESNGLNHAITTHNNVKCVIIPGKRIYTLRRSCIQQVAKARSLASDGPLSQQRIQGQMEDMMNNMNSRITTATGTRAPPARLPTPQGLGVAPELAVPCKALCCVALRCVK